jgi:fatty acid desaturase
MNAKQQIQIQAEKIGKTISPLLILLMIFSVCGYMANLYFYQIGSYGFLLFSIFSAFTLYNVFGVFHDGVHGLIFPNNKKLNNYLSFLLGLLVNFPFRPWKEAHIAHHKYTNTKKDPDDLLTEELNFCSVASSILINCFARIFVSFPFQVRRFIRGRMSKRAKVFLYLFEKNQENSRYYASVVFFVLLSVLLLGFDSPIIMWYISTFFAAIPIILFTSLIPHSGNFEKRNINEDEYKVARNYSFPFIIGCQHLTHHLYPTVQVTRLNMFSKKIDNLIKRGLDS